MMSESDGGTARSGCPIRVGTGVILLLLSACGGSDPSGTSDSTTTTTNVVESTTDVRTTAEPSTTVESTGSTTPTTSTPTSTTTEADDDLGVTFADPQGTYEIRIGGNWVPVEDPLLDERELFHFDAAGPVETADNVQIETAQIGGTSLEQYVNGLKSMSQLAGGNVVFEGEQFVENDAGQPMAVLERRNTATGNRSLDVLVVHEGQAIVATLEATAATFDELRTQVEPLLLTLIAT